MNRTVVFALLTLLTTTPSFANDACSKLRQAEYVVQVDVRSQLYWNGSPTSQAQFEQYLQGTSQSQPRAVFHVVWRKDNAGDAAKLVKEIQASGFEVAFDCPPIPF